MTIAPPALRGRTDVPESESAPWWMEAGRHRRAVIGRTTGPQDLTNNRHVAVATPGLHLPASPTRKQTTGTGEVGHTSRRGTRQRSQRSDPFHATLGPSSRNNAAMKRPTTKASREAQYTV